MKLKADDVARYLSENPGFFEEYSEMLSQISVPHPHGGRAIALSDRQVLALRDKNKQLDSKLSELIQFGEENDALSEKLHRLTLALIAAHDLESAVQTLYFNLREDFAVPHTALRIWHARSDGSPPECRGASQDSRDFAESLTNPYCSAHPMVDTASWFGEDAPRLRSFAYVPLRQDQAFGLLALASEDAQRFYPEMGTLYLKRLGELAAAALLRFLR